MDCQDGCGLKNTHTLCRFRPAACIDRPRPAKYNIKVIATFDEECGRMKANHPFFVVVALALCALMAFTGCAASGKTAAKVGDREITVQQLENAYNNALAYAFYYGYDTSTEEGRLAFADYMLDSIIYSELLAYKAAEAGITLTDEERAGAETAAAEAYDAFYQDFVDYAQQSGASDVKAYANKLLTDALVQNNTNISRIKADYLQSEIDAILTQKHKDQLLEGVAPTADELRAMYDEALAEQQAAIAEDASAYFNYANSYSYGYSYMPLVVPEGLFRVRQILVEDEATANEVLKKIEAGQDFEALLAEYNTDPGMESEANAEGYLVGKGASFVEAFLNAALELTEDGQVSPAVESDYGFHIIKRVRAEEARTIPYAEVQEEFDAMATENFIAKYYSDIVDGWMESGIVQRYPESYASLVKE